MEPFMRLTSYTFLCGYKFTERLSGSLGGSYSLSNQSSQTITSEYNYYSIKPQSYLSDHRKIVSVTGV